MLDQFHSFHLGALSLQRQRFSREQYVFDHHDSRRTLLFLQVHGGPALTSLPASFFGRSFRSSLALGFENNNSKTQHDASLSLRFISSAFHRRTRFSGRTNNRMNARSTSLYSTSRQRLFPADLSAMLFPFRHFWKAKTVSGPFVLVFLHHHYCFSRSDDLSSVVTMITERWYWYSDQIKNRRSVPF